MLPPVRAFSLLLLLAIAASAADLPRFTGAPSCASSSCHGGGPGKDQSLSWTRKDIHSRAHSILANARSARMAETLKLGDPAKAARCTVCHSPLDAVPPERFVRDAKADTGVACESCHGPAEPWLRTHTRPDLNHAQRIAAGMRELRDFYQRANACIACHQNLDPELLRAGHPELFFDFDGQMAAQPPHWKDAGTWLGPRAWLVGQAAALREMSWKLTGTRNDALAQRVRGLAWLLRHTESGAGILPDESARPAEMQAAADRLAQAAAKLDWSRDTTAKLLRIYSCKNLEFRDATDATDILRRRAEVLVLAIDRLWSALKADGAKSPTLDTALSVTADQARAQTGFDKVRFAAALLQIEVALERMDSAR